MNIEKNYRYCILVIIVFFVGLVLVSGRGASYDVRADEYTQSAAKEKNYRPAFFVLTAVVLFALSSKDKRLYFQHFNNYQLWFGFFGLLFILAFFRDNYVEDLSNFAGIFVSYAAVIILLKFAYAIPFDKLENLFVNILFTLTVLCAVVHVLQGNKIVFFPNRSMENLNRLGGLVYYAHAGAIAGLTILFSFIKFLKKWSIKYGLYMLVSGVILIATDTRSVWFAVMFSTIIIIFKKVNFYLILVLATAFYLNVNVFTGLITQHSSTISNTGEDADFRYKIWDFAVEVGEKRIATGFGAAKPLEQYHFSLNKNLHDPHNSLLSLFLQSGLWSVLLYLVIYFTNANKCMSKFHSEYRFLFFFWIFFPFFWGRLYDTLIGILPTIIFFSIYAFALNPNKVIELKRQENIL